MILRVQKSNETFATYSHAIALIFALAGSVYLIVLARENIGSLITTIIYSFGLCFMFGASAFYHSVREEDFEETVWRKVDDIAIYFMIAGSYTAVSYLYTDGIFRWTIMIIQWGFAVAGTILKILFIKVPVWIDVGIYLVMGWMIVIRFNYILKTFPLRIFLLVLFGGIAYTVGAIFHALKKQKPFPGVFVFHDIFHVLIIVGASVQYSAILYAFI